MHPKALAAHFKKAAAYHEKIANDHEKCMKAHEAHADVHEEAMGKGTDDKAYPHKKAAQFHKSMAGNHEKLNKSNTAYAEHLHKLHEACTESDTAKIAKLLELDEGEIMTKVTDTPTPAPVVTQDPAPAVVPPVVTVGEPAINFEEEIGKALNIKLKKAADDAFDRVLNSEDFNKQVDQKIAAKLLEKLGNSTVETNIRTFPVPRNGEVVVKTGSGERVGIDPSIAHFVSMEK